MHFYLQRINQRIWNGHVFRQGLQFVDDMPRIMYTISMNGVPEAAGEVRFVCDAYRGCPIDPIDANVFITAMWHPLRRIWVFFMMHSLAYGLASGVLSYNRFPTLHTAVLRRMFVVLAAASLTICQLCM